MRKSTLDVGYSELEPPKYYVFLTNQLRRLVKIKVVFRIIYVYCCKLEQSNLLEVQE